MNLYSKIQEKIIFTEKANPRFFHYEVNTNITSNYQIYEREYVFKGNISKTFANNTFANIIFSTDPFLIEDTIAYHIDKICNKDLKLEKETLLRMRNAIYDALEMPLPINIFEYIFKLNKRHKEHIKEFERIIDYRLNMITTISTNSFKQLDIITKENDYNICVPNKDEDDLKLSKKDIKNIRMIHEIVFLIYALGFNIGKKIDLRRELAKSINLDLTDKIILRKIEDRKSNYFSNIEMKSFSNSEICKKIDEYLGHKTENS